MSKKTVASNFNAIDNHTSLTCDIKTVSKVFNSFFSSLAESLLVKPLFPPNKYNVESVFLYYSKSLRCFTLKTTSEENVSKIMQNIGDFESCQHRQIPWKVYKKWRGIFSQAY